MKLFHKSMKAEMQDFIKLLVDLHKKGQVSDDAIITLSNDLLAKFEKRGLDLSKI